MSLKSTINILRKHPLLTSLVILIMLLAIGASQITSKKADKELQKAQVLRTQAQDKVDKLKTELNSLLKQEQDAIAELNSLTKLAAQAQSPEERKEATRNMAVAEKNARKITKNVRDLREDLAAAEQDNENAQRRLTEAIALVQEATRLEAAQAAQEFSANQESQQKASQAELEKQKSIDQKEAQKLAKEQERQVELAEREALNKRADAEKLAKKEAEIIAAKMSAQEQEANRLIEQRNRLIDTINSTLDDTTKARKKHWLDALVSVEKDMVNAETALTQNSQQIKDLQKLVDQIETQQRSVIADIAERSKTAAIATTVGEREEANKQLGLVESQAIKLSRDLQSTRDRLEQARRFGDDSQLRKADVSSQHAAMRQQLARIDSEMGKQRQEYQSHMQSATQEQLEQMLVEISDREKQRIAMEKAAVEEAELARREMQKQAKEQERLALQAQKEIEKQHKEAEESARALAKAQEKAEIQAIQEEARRIKEAEKQAEAMRIQAEKAAQAQAKAAEKEQKEEMRRLQEIQEKAEIQLRDAEKTAMKIAAEKERALADAAKEQARLTKEAERKITEEAEKQRQAIEAAAREKEKQENEARIRLEKDRVEAEKLARQKIAEEERLAREAAKEKDRQIKLAREQMEKEKREAEQIAQEMAENAKKEAQKVRELEEEKRKAIELQNLAKVTAPQSKPKADDQLKAGQTLEKAQKEAVEITEKMEKERLKAEKQKQKEMSEAAEKAEKELQKQEKEMTKAAAAASIAAEKERLKQEGKKPKELTDQVSPMIAAATNTESAPADQLSPREIEKLRRNYEQAGARYNQSQSNAADQARRIDEYQFKIKSLEDLEVEGEAEVVRLDDAVKNALDRDMKKSAQKERKEAQKKVADYRRQLKAYRDDLADTVKKATSAQKELELASSELRQAENKYAPYLVSERKLEDLEQAELRAKEETKQQAELRRQQENIAKELERRKKQEALQLAEAKEKEEQLIMAEKDKELKVNRELEEQERRMAQLAAAEKEKADVRAQREAERMARLSAKEQEELDREKKKRELEEKLKAETAARELDKEKQAMEEALLRKESKELDAASDDSLAREAAELAMQATAKKSQDQQTVGTEQSMREKAAAEEALKRFNQKKIEEEKIRNALVEKEKAAAELALKKAVEDKRIQLQEMGLKASAIGGVPSGSLPSSGGMQYDEIADAKARAELKAAEDKLQQAQVELYNLENEIAPQRINLKNMENKEREAKQFYVEMTKRAAAATADDWSKVMSEIAVAEQNVNAVMEELKDARFQEAKMNIQTVQARKNVEEARARLEMAQKKSAEIHGLKAMMDKTRLQRMASDTIYDRDISQRDAVELEMEMKSKQEVNNAEITFNQAQEAAHKAERNLENLRLTVRGLQDKEQEARDAYAQKTQEALLAKGKDQWYNALSQVRDAESNAMQIMSILKDYQDQEAKAELEVGNTAKDLELARNRLQMAQRSNQIYEEAARERMERDRLRKIELEMASTRAQKAGEKTASGTAGPDGVSYQGAWPPKSEGKDVNARASEPDGKKYDINSVVVTGDRDAVYALSNWSQYENDALYTPMSEADIESFRQRLLKDLQDQGYVFSTVSVYKHSLNLGFLKFRVHVGKKGDVTVVGNRWYTAKQILDSASWETGEKFNYRKLYANLFDFNTRPDVRVNTKLMPKVDEFGQRIVDVEMSIEDHFPIHGSLSLSNTGSDETGDWRLRSTLQHLNLTRRNDILSLEWLTDPQEVSQVNAFSGSYYLPMGKERGLTLYAGYSESDINDIEPLIDVFGEGYYVGTQYSKILKQTDDFNMDATFGWLYQYSQNEVTFGNNTPTNREVTLSMPSLSIGYSEKVFDSFNGRNYLSNTLIFNFEGKLGSSNAEEFRLNTPSAEGNFIVDRFQFARYQRLFTGENEPGKWTMFLRVDAQLADDSLVPAMQKGIGGANSVRGYEEREVSADSGVSGSLELHTPLVTNFIPGLVRTDEFLAANPEDWKMHRLQFIAFYDFGQAQQTDPLPGENKSESMSSIGAGFRLGLTKYTQVRMDYGYPLDKTDASDSGRSHLQLQLQF